MYYNVSNFDKFKTQTGYVINMIGSEWVKVPSYHKNRLHEHRSTKGKFDANKLKLQSSRSVTAYSKKSDPYNIIKLDGHTRSEYYKIYQEKYKDDLEFVVTVIVIDDVYNTEESFEYKVEIEYENQDHSSRKKTASDTMCGASRDEGVKRGIPFEPTTDIFKNYKLTYQIQTLGRYFFSSPSSNMNDDYKVVPHVIYDSYLNFDDFFYKFDVKNSDISGVFAAMTLTYMHDYENSSHLCNPFWEKYLKIFKSGSKLKNKVSDMVTPMEMIVRYYLELKDKRYTLASDGLFPEKVKQEIDNSGPTHSYTGVIQFKSAVPIYFFTYICLYCYEKYINVGNGKTIKIDKNEFATLEEIFNMAFVKVGDSYKERQDAELRLKYMIDNTNPEKYVFTPELKELNDYVPYTVYDDDNQKRLF